MSFQGCTTDGERLHAVLGDAFLEKAEPLTTTPTELTELCDLDAPRYQLKVLNEQSLVDALQAFVAD